MINVIKIIAIFLSISLFMTSCATYQPIAKYSIDIYIYDIESTDTSYKHFDDLYKKNTLIDKNNKLYKDEVNYLIETQANYNYFIYSCNKNCSSLNEIYKDEYLAINGELINNKIHYSSVQADTAPLKTEENTLIIVPSKNIIKIYEIKYNPIGADWTVYKNLF